MHLSLFYSHQVCRSRVRVCEREIVCVCVCVCVLKQINYLCVTFIIILSHLFFCYLAANICVSSSLSRLLHSVAVFGLPCCFHCVCILFIVLASTANMKGNFLSIQSGSRPDIKLNGSRERRYARSPCVLRNLEHLFKFTYFDCDVKFSGSTCVPSSDLVCISVGIREPQKLPH